MKEIIKRGTREVITCRTCGCKFAYEKEDIINIDLDAYKAFKEYVTCPQCDAEVVIRQSK